MAESDQALADNVEEDIHPEFITFRAVLVLLVATLATASYSFTWNAVSIALPHMKGTFSATTDQVTWVMISYVVGSAMATASVSWFAGRFGRRRMFLLAITGFTLTQFGCATAATLETEVAWRFVQGVMGAPLIPLTQVIAVNAFPKARYTQATSLWALGFILANVVAPTLAGYIIDDFGWPAIFFVTVPISTICLLAGYVLIPASPRQSKPMDWIGFLSLILAVGCFQLMISRGERLDWFYSPEIIAEAIAAIIFVHTFIVRTILATSPFIDRSLFTDWNFVLGQFCVFAVGMSMFIPLMLIPLQLQQLGGYPASEIGVLIMARGVGSIISLIFISRMGDKFEPRTLMTFGLVITAAGTWMMSQWTPDVRATDVFAANFVMGIAVGSVWAPMNKLALARLPKRVQDQGFAVFYLVFDMGYAIGTALIIALFTRHSQIGHALFAEHISPFNRGLQSSNAINGGWDISGVEGLAAIDNEITRQAAAVAFNNSYMVLSVVLLSIIPILLFFRKRPED
ncbi:MAG: DHA2 family efflux MFS transporter permease subunit [Rhodospirillales bacterium]|jgi:MFS transporter, DHA2 family, multidrug resistance protein|nr:DHA2 family efflux MFS transporter permease subunit [Rhodospirillales bacterium]MBT4040851.1 DHA2 family efflux MFS transporter permease subunit [Rhodospirillales bacterium]MBT4625404.1 DHA2 family efflux MFS transporter permease subunit [Rhodospirillales bacterium]MBT5351940.1 DHA2 family efflux MFS transporter permease subunit [Rhodospirillales bacterium]MBT5521147.1 DHA2 family efflux MFS transporter permease subunit [Rhodospirillales bacterium]